MRLTEAPGTQRDIIRRAAVAGSFYPADPGALDGQVDGLLARIGPAVAARTPAGHVAGILVPHAGLDYSGGVAAVAWRHLAQDIVAPRDLARVGPPTLVLLGTVHRAWWLDGVGVWDAGAWRTPIGDVEVDEALAADILALGQPFLLDRRSHGDEHSLEVQLPFVQRLLPGARIVPLATAAGTGADAIEAGSRLGELLADRRASGSPVTLVISTDMAHYPPEAIAASITETLSDSIRAVDPGCLAADEAAVARSGLPGVVCGMCGIAPAVAGLAALRAMGVVHGSVLAVATSADAGGPTDRTVGYLAAAFPD